LEGTKYANIERLQLVCGVGWETEKDDIMKFSKVKEM
jgi:hypothetical protein